MNLNYSLILGSKSPRRQHLLKSAGYSFDIWEIKAEETYPNNLPAQKIAAFLAEKKALSVRKKLRNKQLLITADTIVKLDNEILGKPGKREEAVDMLMTLSGRSHEVITGVCLCSRDKIRVFDDTTVVYFKNLSEEEINFYVDQFEPYDKAGAYGIQEWIGMTGVNKIEGSYFNVVGLPIHKVYKYLTGFGIFPDKFKKE